MDSVKVNPPNPGILAKKIQEALASVAARRRLQGLPDKPKPRFLNVLAGLSPDKFMGAWKAAVEETAALANGGAARALADAPATAVVTATAPGTVLSKEVDADGRWPEYVWVGGGEKTQCRMCSVGPGKTADHWTSGNTLDTMRKYTCTPYLVLLDLSLSLSPLSLTHTHTYTYIQRHP